MRQAASLALGSSQHVSSGACILQQLLLLQHLLRMRPAQDASCHSQVLRQGGRCAT
jgi:hypothetical protein